MRRIFTVFVAVLFGLVSCGAAPPVMRICVRPVGGHGVSCGTGTAVADTPYVITAHHVVDDFATGAMMMIRTHTDTVIFNKVDLYSDSSSDISIIRVPTIRSGRELPLCLAEPGEEVSIYSLDKIRHGRVLFATDTTVYIDDGEDGGNRVIPGNSGSPIVSDERKCIVGLATAILWSKDKEGNNIKYIWSTAVSSEVIMWLINQMVLHDISVKAAQIEEQVDAGSNSK